MHNSHVSFLGKKQNYFFILLVLLFSVVLFSGAQRFFHIGTRFFSVNDDADSTKSLKRVSDLQPDKDNFNLTGYTLFSDSLVSSFIVWVKEGIKPHIHQFHSKLTYVIDGEGEFRVGVDTFKVKAGDFIYAPPNVVHSLKVLSEKSMKLIITQAPFYDGSDVIFKE